MLDSAFDFYALFKKHADEFKQAKTYAEFCSLCATKQPQRKEYWEYVAKYQWAIPCFETAKAGKTSTYHPLMFPHANTFADIFEDAIFVSIPVGGERSNMPLGYYFIGGTGSMCKHIGGTRAYSKTMPDVRSHSGAKFHSTYVKPKQTIIDASNASLVCGPTASFEAIKRDDGILILSRDSHGIGSRWIALLDRNQDITQMFNADTKQMLANERADEIKAWGESEDE